MPTMSRMPTIALAGNPNVGKSTIFNALTGARQHVGNWPGKTVEKKEGIARFHDRDITIIDLPGTYSLNAFSLEEVVARDFLINESPGGVIAVADASNLERNLYLVTQLLELDLPLVLVLNMVDTAHQRGLDIDTAVLSAGLGGIPVIETIGSQGNGIDALQNAIAEIVDHPIHPARLDYGPALETEIAALEAEIERDPVLRNLFRPRWLAIKLLEHDPDIAARIEDGGYPELAAAARAATDRLAAGSENDADDLSDAETLLADRRYQFIG
ncbi:MAG: ferrous iron transporter B, partial [Anaerolineae bacterium]|nr:ferrous iron transporter B [Anaerolineae bacterium]